MYHDIRYTYHRPRRILKYKYKVLGGKQSHTLSRYAIFLDNVRLGVGWGAI